MTTLNVNVSGLRSPATYTGINQGLCDASNDWTKPFSAHHPDVTIVSQTDGTSAPSTNVTTIQGGFFGMKLTISPTGTGPANDGTHATFKYVDGYDVNGDGTTGGADIAINADVTFQAPSLFGASSYPGVNISTLAGLTPATMDAGQRVAKQMGDTIRFKSGFAGPAASIIAGISALTLIDRLPLRADNSVTLLVNLNWHETVWSITDINVADVSGATVPAVLVNSAAAGNAAGGVILTNLGMNAAALTARLTVQYSGSQAVSLLFK